MRYLRRYPRIERNSAITRVVKLRYTFDVARDPDNYVLATLGKVLRDREDVLILTDVDGEILTRYQLVGTVQVPQLWRPARQAYELLREL